MQLTRPKPPKTQFHKDKKQVARDAGAGSHRFSGKLCKPTVLVVAPMTGNDERPFDSVFDSGPFASAPPSCGSSEQRPKSQDMPRPDCGGFLQFLGPGLRSIWTLSHRASQPGTCRLKPPGDRWQLLRRLAAMGPAIGGDALFFFLHAHFVLPSQVSLRSGVHKPQCHNGFQVNGHWR